MLFDLPKKLEKEEKKSNELTHRVFKSLDEENLILEVDFRNKKFIIEKTFTNNFDGKDKLKKTIQEFDSDEKVKSYLNLK